MKTPIELLNEVYNAGKYHPEMYDTIKIDDGILVAAMIKLAQDLEDFKKSKPAASEHQEEIPENSLTIASLYRQLYTCLTGTSFPVQRERALKVYNLLKSF